MLNTLKARFEKNPQRHPDVSWQQVEERLLGNEKALASLLRMEESGGEPDVIGLDESGALLFCDCARETPAGRRSLCYDDEALKKRKSNPPSASAVAQAEAMGVRLLSEAEYYRLQSLGEFDLKTSSWVAAPPEIRQKGGALFCEKRYGRVFTFHNGAESYYSVRGWRGLLRV